MNIHYTPTAENGLHRVLCVHSPSKHLQPPPEAPFITIDEDVNAPLYWDIATHPSKYLVDSDSGELFVDEEWSADEV